jgi:hypothetical protein
MAAEHRSYAAALHACSASHKPTADTNAIVAAGFSKQQRRSWQAFCKQVLPGLQGLLPQL